MKATLALAFILPFVAPNKAGDLWQPFTSADSRIRFEMPTEPLEQRFKSQGGGNVNMFTSQQEEVVYEVVAMDMSVDLKMAMQEAISDAEVSVSRQVLDGTVEGFLEELEARPVKTEYSRFHRLLCRTTTAKLSGKRSATLMSVIGKDHAYLFIVSSPTARSDTFFKRFLSSVRFE